MTPNKAWEVMYQGWKGESFHDLFLSLAQLEEAKRERKRLVRGCRGKMAFQDFLVAMLTANKMTRNGDVNQGCHLSIYRCEICQCEHIGNRHS